MNASRAPGEWQVFDVKFTAPKFDASGKKIANARFDWVKHNGVLIHENVELNGPTRAALDENKGVPGRAADAPGGPWAGGVQEFRACGCSSSPQRRIEPQRRKGRKERI